MTSPTAAAILIASVGLAGWSFRSIVRRYRTLRGFPWLASFVFAAAAAVAVLALHVLLAP